VTRDQAAATIAAALDAIDAAFWAACDAAAGPIDPADLGAPDGLLDEAFDTAERVQAIAAERGLTWPEARDLV